MKNDSPMLHTSFRSNGLHFDVYASKKGIRKLSINEKIKSKDRYIVETSPDDPRLFGIAQQLEEYFAGSRKTFKVPLDPEGTEFQKTVWKALSKIKYGHLKSYKDIAFSIGAPKAVRAVGQSNGKNPIPIIVPCHRVINSDGSIGGYSAGTGLKKKLINLEMENS